MLAAAPAVPERSADPIPSAFSRPVPTGKITTANPRSIVAALQERGYKAVLAMEDGKPYVESAANGGRFFIYLQNCKEKRDCQDVIFTSSYEKKAADPVKLEAINDFNLNNRWARAYLNKDGGPVLEMDVLFTDQVVDKKMFGEAIDIWAEMLTTFHKTIDF
jgi:hypothetical protein